MKRKSFRGIQHPDKKPTIANRLQSNSKPKSALHSQTPDYVSLTFQDASERVGSGKLTWPRKLTLDRTTDAIDPFSASGRSMSENWVTSQGAMSTHWRTWSVMNHTWMAVSQWTALGSPFSTEKPRMFDFQNAGGGCQRRDLRCNHHRFRSGGIKS
jgi:hypothetical protein